MFIKYKTKNNQLARVYVGEIGDRNFEFVESTQPPLPIDEKWVLIVSTLYGCPVKCLMCDACQEFKGYLSKSDIIKQIDYLVTKRFPNRVIPVKKFKIQFARMGEPTFNFTVLDVLKELPQKYKAPGLMPSISTIGPKYSSRFLKDLIKIKNSFYRKGNFQMQFSIHTTDFKKRNELIPCKKMDFQEIANYGKEFYTSGDRKIALNFIVMENYSIDPAIVRKFFDPRFFIIKLTPLNPTKRAIVNKLKTKLNPHDDSSVTWLVEEFRHFGFETIVSIGELEENKIGSNCGQYVS